MPTSAIMGLGCRQSGCTCWSSLDPSAWLTPRSRVSWGPAGTAFLSPASSHYGCYLDSLAAPGHPDNRITHFLCKHSQCVIDDVMASHRYPKSNKYYNRVSKGAIRRTLEKTEVINYSTISESERVTKCSSCFVKVRVVRGKAGCVFSEDLCCVWASRQTSAIPTSTAISLPTCVIMPQMDTTTT